MMIRLLSCAVALTLLAVAAPAAAQTSIRDRDILNREHSGNLSSEERGQLDGIKASKAAEDAKHEAGLTAARMRQAQALRKTPPLPPERNGLLGSWRLGDGQRSKEGAVDVLTSSRSSLAESLAALSSFDNFGCQLDWGGGITFTPSTFSWRKAGGRSVEGAPIAYRSGRRGAKQITVAITDYDYAMAFEIASPNSIVDDKGCVLTRVGAPAANAATNATAAPGNARAGASGQSAPAAAAGLPQVAAVAPAPPPAPSRPPPEVCRNTLLDQLGTVGVAQVRAMAKVRYTEPTLEGKVPNTDNLRLDLRGSACGEDPRVKATLYDFDANGMLQSITYVWDRPPGPAPAPIFQERVATLSRFHSLPQPQSTGRLQADTSLGRLVLQDLPERNLLLEAYAARK
jgi:hypothetical protein